MATASLRDRLWAHAGLPWAGELRGALGCVTTFAFVTCTWVFFRAESIGDAWVLLQKIFTLPLVQAGRGLGFLQAQDQVSFWLGCGLLVSFVVVEILEEKWSLWSHLLQRPWYVRWALYYGAAMAFTLLSMTGQPQEFVYFQF